MSVSRDELVRMYDVMTTIMQCDERLRNLMMSGQVNMFYHSPRGQEVVASAIGTQLTQQDYLVTTYRGMHDVIAKGVPLPLIWGEWLGKSSGLARGRGGPMHLSDPTYGVMLATGIVGSGLPIATGLAFAAQYRSEPRVTVCSFGDGATNIGAFHEALNVASLWSLPVLFLCQNNGYAESTSYAKGTAVDHVVDRAAGYRMTGIDVDGDDPPAMYEAAREAIGHIREGRGPVLLEARTNRLKGHYFGDPMKYVPAEELAAAVAADPVPRFRSWLIENGHASEDDLAKIEDRAKRDIEDAYLAARESPEPPSDELLDNVYGEAVTA